MKALGVVTTSQKAVFFASIPTKLVDLTVAFDSDIYFAVAFDSEFLS